MGDEPPPLTAAEVAWVRGMMAIDRVGDDTPWGEQQLASRALLFQNVDRQIRARVAQVMPGILTDAKHLIDKQLGAETITARVSELRDHMARTVRRSELQFESTASVLVKDAIQSVVERGTGAILTRLEKRVRSVVAAECAKQLRRVMNPPAIKASKAPPKKRKTP